jgi:long-chain acyl-CoA synthetase
MEMRKTERFDQETLSSLTNNTIPQILFKQAKELGENKIAIREKMYGIWLSYNWTDYFRYTKNVALGLKALGLKSTKSVDDVVKKVIEWNPNAIEKNIKGLVSNAVEGCTGNMRGR